MSKKEMMHQMALNRQDMQFERNAHIRQKIYAGIFTAFVILFWAWLIDYDSINWWYGIVAGPFILFGLWLMVTKTNYPWEFIQEAKGEER